MPSPQLQTIISLLRTRSTANAELDLQQVRATFDAVSNMVRVASDVTLEPVDVDGTPGEWISTPEASPDRIVLYLHGGGYVIGSIDSHREMISRIARSAAARTLAIDYRLAPEHPFPAAVEDATKAYRWLLKQGFSPKHIVISGDSAGGGLTVAALLALRDAGDPLPAAAACISPWTDLEITGESMITKADVDPMIRPDEAKDGAERYCGAADPGHPLISPINADLSGLPPLLIQVGTSEVLLSDSTRLAERAKAAGVDVTIEEWDEMIHVWHFFAFMLPEGHQAIQRIGEFVREKTGAKVAAQTAS